MNHSISFPKFKGQVKLSEIKVPKNGITLDGVHYPKGMRLYTYSANVEGTEYKFVIRAFNREDAIFRAKSRFPNGKFFKGIKKSPA
jgi:hypothetical protein